MIFVLLIEVIASHIVITPINIRKTYFEKIFIGGFAAISLAFITI